MGSNNNYMKLIEARQAIEEKTERLVLAKLSYLRKVSNSVMKKSYGGDHWIMDDLSYLGELGYWLQSSDLNFVRLEEHFVVFHHVRLNNRMPKGELKLPRRYIHMSDREFAKELRLRVRIRKDYLRKLKIQNAEADLQKTLAQIEKHTSELRRLEKLLEKSKDKRIPVAKKV